MTKDQLMELAYQSVSKRLNVTADEFNRILKDWNFIPLTENNEVIGAIAQKENELHIEYWKKAKSSILRHIRKPLKDAIDKYGFAKTCVTEDSLEGIKFCKRLNFVEIGRDSGTILLRCHRSKYA